MFAAAYLISLREMALIQVMNRRILTAE